MALLGVALLIAACSGGDDEDEPSVDPTATSSASTSPTAAAADPTATTSPSGTPDDGDPSATAQPDDATPDDAASGGGGSDDGGSDAGGSDDGGSETGTPDDPDPTATTTPRPTPTRTPVAQTFTGNPLATVTYQPTDEIFANPERGLYVSRSSGSVSSGYNHLASGALVASRQNDSITLLHRYFMLSDFVDSDISEAYLSAVQADFNAVRAAGMKVIVRFSYTNSIRNEGGPYGDASVDRILRHIDQLTPVLQANSDVIAVVQAGFVGVWGEWAFTDHFEDAYASSFPGRSAVLNALLDAVPASRQVQVRATRFKQDIPVSEPYRVGFHNDCFMRGDTDAGAFRDGAASADKAYLAAETRAVAMGGETCGIPWPPEYQECNVALGELSRFHWSYINGEYHPEALNHWRSTGCMDDVERQLGYRFELTKGTYQRWVQPGDAFSIDLSVRNVGMAAPYNWRPVELVLRNTATRALYRATLPSDTRSWSSDGSPVVRLSYDICTPSGLPQGSYDLFLNLPDGSGSLYGRPEYSIHLANDGVWESTTGFNRLDHRLVVSSAAPPTACDGSELDLLG